MSGGGSVSPHTPYEIVRRPRRPRITPRRVASAESSRRLPLPRAPLQPSCHQHVGLGIRTAASHVPCVPARRTASAGRLSTTALSPQHCGNKQTGPPCLPCRSGWGGGGVSHAGGSNRRCGRRNASALSVQAGQRGRRAAALGSPPSRPDLRLTRRPFSASWALVWFGRCKGPFG